MNIAGATDIVDCLDNAEYVLIETKEVSLPKVVLLTSDKL